MTLREALKAMGYHEARPKRWAKPVGFHLFTYSEEYGAWENWFLGADNDEPKVWARKEFGPVEESGSFVTQIKDWEAYTRINIDVSARASFEGRGVDL